jgi:hypothetical protein
MSDPIVEAEGEDALSPDIFWPVNSLFDPNRVLLRRIFFIVGDKTKYVSVSFYPARDYQPLVEFGTIRRGSGSGSKSIILASEHVDKLAERLLEGSATSESSSVSGGGNFRLTRNRGGSGGGAARLYLDTQYISLTSEDLRYLARMFHILHKQLRDYIAAMPDVLSYVTASLTSTSYTEPAPNASPHINYPHLYKELISFV